MNAQTDVRVGRVRQPGLLKAHPARRRAMKRVAKTGLIVAGVVLLLVGLLPMEVIGECAYSQTEYQLTFQDATGAPVEGVELRVEDGEGTTFFYFPVTDYLPRHVPASDARGLMTFHHVTSGIEWSSHRTLLFFGSLPIRSTKPPRFICRFLYQGQEVYRFPFHELDFGDETQAQRETVKRNVQWSGWPPPEIDDTREDESLDEWQERMRRFFDFNGNGKLDPEEAAVRHACTGSRAERIVVARWRGVDLVEEIEFGLARRTITIDVPGRQ
jgi:hypothetical protein